MNDGPKQDLVIGAIRGYSFGQLRPFVLSLRRTGFDGAIVLLWNRVDGASRHELAKQGVELIPFAYRGSGLINSWSRFWPKIRLAVDSPVGNSFRHAIYRRVLNLAFVRYMHILTFLNANRGRFGNVLMTDVRDVIFQDLPFRYSFSGKIEAFLEDRTMCFGSDQMNSDWLEENYGAAVLQRYRGLRISCCGTVIGGESSMVRYLQAFVGEIRRLRSVAHGADTSVHNVVIRDRFGPDCLVTENMEGSVGTIGRTTAEQLRRDSEGRVVDNHGRLVPILHQYDRHADLVGQIEKALANDSRW